MTNCSSRHNSPTPWPTHCPHAGSLLVTAVPPGGSSVYLRAGVNSTGLRLLEVGEPGTLSLGSILTDLGLAAGGLDTSGIMTLTNTTVQYVPQAGVKRQVLRARN